LGETTGQVQHTLIDNQLITEHEDSKFNSLQLLRNAEWYKIISKKNSNIVFCSEWYKASNRVVL